MGLVHVEGCEVGPGAAPLVFVFDAHLRDRGEKARRNGYGETRLDARFVVEGLAFPAPLIQIKDGCGRSGFYGGSRWAPSLGSLRIQPAIPMPRSVCPNAPKVPSRRPS